MFPHPQYAIAGINICAHIKKNLAMAFISLSLFVQKNTAHTWTTIPGRMWLSKWQGNWCHILSLLPIVSPPPKQVYYCYLPKTGTQKKRQEATHPFCLHTQCRNSECGLVPLWTTRPPARETPGPPTICPPPVGTVCVPPESQDPLSPMPWHRPGLAGCARGTSPREAGSSCSPPRCSRP